MLGGGRRTRGPGPRRSSELAEELSGPRDAVREALKLYVVWNVVALVVVAIGVVLVSGVIARKEAIRDAEHTARAVAEALVVPLADRGFHAPSG